MLPDLSLLRESSGDGSVRKELLPKQRDLSSVPRILRKKKKKKEKVWQAGTHL